MPVYFPNLLDVALGEMEEMGIRKKPAPDMVYKALAELRCDKKNAVYIGDSDVDLATAKASEMDCIGVSWGYQVIFSSMCIYKFKIYRLVHGSRFCGGSGIWSHKYGA